MKSRRFTFSLESIRTVRKHTQLVAMRELGRARTAARCSQKRCRSIARSPAAVSSRRAVEILDRIEPL